METKYQNEVNAGTGRMGPTNSAYWKDIVLKNPVGLASQPLEYRYGNYIPAFDQNAFENSISFRSGFGRKGRRKGSRKSGKKVRKCKSKCKCKCKSCKRCKSKKCKSQKSRRKTRRSRFGCCGKMY